MVASCPDAIESEIHEKIKREHYHLRGDGGNRQQVDKPCDSKLSPSTASVPFYQDEYLKL